LEERLRFSFVQSQLRMELVRELLVRGPFQPSDLHTARKYMAEIGASKLIDNRDFSVLPSWQPLAGRDLLTQIQMGPRVTVSSRR
jgi:hypothetical protein